MNSKRRLQQAPGATATASADTSTEASQQALDTLARFAGAMLRTRDLDPVYPVLRHLNARDDRDPALIKRGEAGEWTGEGAHLRRTLVYVAFYNVAASECVMEAGKAGNSENVARMLAGRAGTERRGLRSPQFMVDHLNALARKQWEFGGFEIGLTDWLQQHWTPESTPQERWAETTNVLLAVPYNGRWAAYKTCDILAEVHDWPMEAPDAGHRFSSGPREGLMILTAEAGGSVSWGLPAHNDQSPAAIEALDRATEAVQRELWAAGVPLKMSEVETILCNWKALVQGRYYIGHDIDEMLGQVLTLPASGEYAPVRERLLRARRDSFAPELLGEMNGWIGVRRELMPRYALTGEMVNVELGR